MPYAPGIQDISGQLLAQGMQQRAQGFAQGFTNFIGGIEQNKRMTNDALAKFQGAVAANPNLLPFLESASNQEDPNAPKINPEIVKAFSEVKQGKTDVWNTALLANFVETYNKSAAEAQMGQMRQAQMQNLQSEMALRQAQQEKTAAETNLLRNPVRKPVYTRDEVSRLFPNDQWDVRVTPTDNPNLVTVESANARAPKSGNFKTENLGGVVGVFNDQGELVRTISKSPEAPAGYEMVNTPNGAVVRPIAGSPQAQQKFERDEKERIKNIGNEATQDVLLNTIDSAMSRVSGKTAGAGAILANLPSTEARALSNELTTIKANLGFDQLAKMRAASPTGGALGQVAVKELDFLQSTLGSLDQYTSEKELKNTLSNIRKSLVRWNEAVSAAPSREETKAVQWQPGAQPGEGRLMPKEAKPYPMPNQKAIDLLKSDPSLRAKFDEIYGPGSASIVLGR